MSAKTIQVKTTSGWCDYCDVGVATDMHDCDGNVLYTGDIVEIVEMRYGAEHAQVINVTMILFDQHMKFITTDKFFAAGWLNQDWINDSVIIRRADASQLPSNAHHKIVTKEVDAQLI